MRKIRSCEQANLQTGGSKCQMDFGKVKGAILVERGTKLPAALTPEKLEELCHADRPGRAMPILTFVEYEKDGGEPQVSAVGYGGNAVTSVSARTDKFTLNKFSEHLNASLLKTMNTAFDVYYFDENNYIYGVKDGDDLAGIEMSTIYPTATMHPTSSAKSELKINFCHEDAQSAMENFDYYKADFNIAKAVVGLVGVELVKTTDNKYKLVESIGGYDRTAEFGELIADNVSAVLDNVTTASYDAAGNTLTLTASKTDVAVTLKKASALYKAGIKGIEQA